MIADIFTTVNARTAEFTSSSLRIKEITGVLRERQEVYARTGGTHAAGVFNKDWELLSFAEDIGRHNALDKALGKIILANKLQDVMVIGLTSRTSYEMVLKASRTPAQILIGMSAPTSLGVDFARKVNITLIGFVKQCRFNIYSGAERVLECQKAGESNA